MKSILAVLAVFGSVAFAADVTDVKVKALDGFGGDTSSVATRCQTKVGKTYDPVTVTRDVESLKSSGEFEEITAEPVQRLDPDIRDVRRERDGPEDCENRKDAFHKWIYFTKFHSSAEAAGSSFRTCL